MPHSTKDTTAIDEWREILTNAHKRRIEAENIRKPVELLHAQYSIAVDNVVKIVLGLRASSDRYDSDPLVIRYVELLLEMGIISSSALLSCLLQQTNHFSAQTANAAVQKTPLPTFEEKVFLVIRDKFNNEQQLGSLWKLHGIVLGLTRWLNAVSSFEMPQQLELGPLHTIDSPTASMYDALGLLVLTIFGHQDFQEIESQPWWKTRRSTITLELNKFDLNVLQWGHSQLTGHLHNLTTTRPFMETDKDGKPLFSRDHISAIITDLPPVNTRTSLCIWLSACLSIRPVLDDICIQNYILMRCHDDIQTAALSLIVASFDVLGNRALKDQHIQQTIRSFICNKIPLLLTSFSVLMTPEMLESCISMALLSLITEPATSSSTSDDDSIIKHTRTEFLQACVLHSILSEPSAVNLLHGQSPKGKVTRYTKAALLAQCTSNINKLDSLVTELTGMSGNVGAIATCVVELIRGLCSSKDSVTLKTTCALLLKKISSMDYILQYVRPNDILVPIWHLLNEWVHEQDQTEFQPPYEEFAVILLFTIAFIDRYGLSAASLGLGNDDSFMTRLTSRGTAFTSLSSLSTEQKKQLSNWIQGLYATDEHGETVGITDDVYSQCPPQAFYLLVPTLFEQTVLACRSKVLTVPIMKGGLEFLLEPFLLPSLIGGLSWIADTPWQDPDDTNVRLQVLDKLLKPANPSQEVQSMHKSILAIVADTLVISLQRLLRGRPEKKKEVDAPLKLLQPHTGQRRMTVASKEKLEKWSSDHRGLKADLRLKIRELATFATHNAAGTPQAYDPVLLWEATQLLGPDEVLNIMIDELVQQEAVSSASVLLDICTALICSPDSQATNPRLLTTVIDKLSLRDCLRCLSNDEAALLNMPFKKSEALIRLGRKVQMQSGASQLTSQMELASIALPDQDASDTAIQSLGLAATDATLDAAAAAIINSTSDNTFESNALITGDSALDLGNATSQDLRDIDLMAIDHSNDIFGDLNINLNDQTNQLSTFGTNTGAEPGAETNPDDDIFGDLDMTNLGDDFTFT